MNQETDLSELEIFMESIIHDLVSQYIFRPDSLRVTATTKLAPDRRRVLVQVTITPDSRDYGKVCGKKGKNISALQVVMEALARAQGCQIGLTLKDENEFMLKRPAPELKNPNLDPKWKVENLVGLIRSILKACKLEHIKAFMQPVSKRETRFNFRGWRGDEENNFSGAFVQLLEAIANANEHTLILDKDLGNDSSAAA